MTEKEKNVARRLIEAAELIRDSAEEIRASLAGQMKELPEYSDRYKELDEECEPILEVSDYAQRIRDILTTLSEQDF